MKIRKHRFYFFILLFATSSLLFQLPSEAFAVDDISATASMTNDPAKLDGAADVAVFTIGSSTYAIVASNAADAVQIIDISDPTNIEATDNMTKKPAKLDGASGVATFTIGSSTYAIVTSYVDHAVQIIDISDPYNIDTTASATDGDPDSNGDTFTELRGATDVAVFTIGSSTYAIVASEKDDGVQIIDISDPTNILATDAATHSAQTEIDFDELDGARGVDVFTIGSSTYAIVTGYHDHGVQIIDISDPHNISATDSMANSSSVELQGATDVDTFTIGSSTYAIVAANADDGVQIIDISDPTNIEATYSMDDIQDGPLELNGARGVDVFTIDSSTSTTTYAMVTCLLYTSPSPRDRG